MNTTIKDLGKDKGNEVTLNGWLYGKRSGGKVVFLQMRDGTGICQCVVEAGVPVAFDLATKLTQESSFSATGRVRKDERAKGGFEIAVTELRLIQLAHEYPITRKAHGIDFLMSNRHLWLRSRMPSAVLRVRHTIIKACRDFFDNQGFTLVDTPILVPGAGEDAQTLFPVEYFDRKLFLAQTGQLYLESACMALGKVYCFGPTFRAEKSKTRRHLTEFWMIEPEVAFAELPDIMNLAEDMICEVIGAVLAKNEDDLKLLGRDVEKLKTVRKPFKRMTYSEAAEVLRSAETKKWLEEELARDRGRLQELVGELEKLEKKLELETKTWQRDELQIRIHEAREAVHDLEAELQNRPEHIRLAQSFEWGKDLGGSDETIISRMSDRPVFVTDYPKQAKAFYMKESAADRRVVRNMDLLAPEGYGEIIGGSQREDDLDRLTHRMKEMGLKPEDYAWYLDLRKYGSVPHGGFGLGIERTISWLCGLKHVRETIPFPRTMGRVYP
ncbi:MAG: asparagine--tRNA ligase [Verrucomicrobia bacterium]|nr:asparagine--tRNA ligase [Verrucomicrobiota bacterium]